MESRIGLVGDVPPGSGSPGDSMNTDVAGASDGAAVGVPGAATASSSVVRDAEARGLSLSVASGDSGTMVLSADGLGSSDATGFDAPPPGVAGSATASPASAAATAAAAASSSCETHTSGESCG
jgi:hypothetical protein